MSIVPVGAKWSLMVLHQGGGHSQTITIQVSEYAMVRDIFAEVKKKVNVGEELRLTTGTKELNSCMDKRIADIGLSHGSTICVVMRQRGGSDPRIQMLQSCDKTTVIGVSTPSLRACPHCGAMVQHTDACKLMTCAACKKVFCFICLKTLTPSGSSRCGGSYTKCDPAARQTSIPG